MSTRGRSWSSRARRDFDEREKYKKEKDEKEEETREDRVDERGYEPLSREDIEAYLMEIRNASLDDDVNERLDRIRGEFDYYESELDRYDADYDRLMADYDRLMAEVEILRRDNTHYMMREGNGAREDLDEAKDRQDKDIRQDNDAELDFDDLWKEREG